MKDIYSIDENDSSKISGGARATKSKTYKFHCKKCGHTWKKSTAYPSEEHGCPECGWWFMSSQGNRDKDGKLIFDNECIEFDPKPKH